MWWFKSRAQRDFEEAQARLGFIKAWVDLTLKCDGMTDERCREAEAEFDAIYALLARVKTGRGGKRARKNSALDEALLRTELVQARAEMQQKTGGLTSENRERLKRELDEATALADNIFR